MKIQLAFWKFNLRFIDFHGYTKMNVLFDFHGYKNAASACVLRQKSAFSTFEGIWLMHIII